MNSLNSMNNYGKTKMDEWILFSFIKFHFKEIYIATHFGFFTSKSILVGKVPRPNRGYGPSFLISPSSLVLTEGNCSLLPTSSFLTEGRAPCCLSQCILRKGPPQTEQQTSLKHYLPSY